MLRLKVSSLKTKTLLTIKSNAYVNIDNSDEIVFQQFKIEHESFDEDPIYRDLYHIVANEELTMEKLRHFQTKTKDFKQV